MQYIRAFDDEILESLNNPDPHFHRHAVEAAFEAGMQLALHGTPLHQARAAFEACERLVQ